MSSLKSLVVCAAAALVLGACGGKGGGASGVVGKWSVDKAEVEKLVIAEAKKNAPEANAEQLEMMTKLAKDAATAMNLNLDIKSDNTFEVAMAMSFMGQEQKMNAKGKWKLDGEKLSMTTTEEDGKAKTTEDTKVATFKDGKISLVMDGGPTIVLKRA